MNVFSIKGVYTMSKETFIQHNSFDGKNYIVEKKVRGERTDVFVYPEGGNSQNHDHHIITPNNSININRRYGGG